jgi:hypothetical protein
MRLPDPQRSRVVLIGTSTYDDPNLPDLPAVARTIGDLQVVLTDPDLGVVTGQNCELLAELNDIGQIGRRLRAAANVAEDLLLVYYVGHGVATWRQHDLYLALPGTSWEAPEFSALEYDKVRSAVLDSPAATKMIVLDCCYSGRALSGTMADPATELISQSEVDGSYVLASAPRDKVSLILPGEERTAFTGRLLDLLHSGLADGPEFLTADIVYRALRAQMKAAGLPEPQKRSSATAGLLALTRNRAFAETAGPSRLRHRVVANDSPHEQDRDLLAEAETTARTITDDDQRAVALSATAIALAGIDPGRAERIAETITDDRQKDEALRKIVTALAGREPARAERVARTITDPQSQHSALADVAEVLAERDPADAERLAATVPEYHRQWPLARIAIVLARQDPAYAERVARSVPAHSFGWYRSSALADIAAVIADQDPADAERIAHSVPGLSDRARALTAIAGKLAGHDPDKARDMFADAEDSARFISEAHLRAESLTELANAMARRDPVKARDLLADAADLAYTLPTRHESDRNKVLAAIVRALTELDPAEAEQVARTITWPRGQIGALADIAKALAGRDPGKARDLLNDAERLARTESDPGSQAGHLIDIATGLADKDPVKTHDLLTSAERLALGIPESGRRSRKLVDIVKVLAEHDVADAERVARTIPESGARDWAVAEISVAIAKRSPAEAERLARTLSDPFLRTQALAQTGKALAEHAKAAESR